jgi:hypothetical protein
MRKARIWRAFRVKKRKFSKNRNGWLGRQDSNLKMVDWHQGDEQPFSQCPLKSRHARPGSGGKPSIKRATILLRIDWLSGLFGALLW